MLGRYRTYCCACATFTSDEQELGPPKARVFDEPLNGYSQTCKETVRQFSWKEIESLTSRFTSAVVGEGGFSTVYLARVPCCLGSTSNLAAVKVHRGSERLTRVFKLELDVLKQVQHPHIVRLLGFCEERGWCY
jgi:Protein tyrosine and serine/threonine kinase